MPSLSGSLAHLAVASPALLRYLPASQEGPLGRHIARIAGLVLAWLVLAAPPVRAQEAELTCDLVMAMQGMISLDEIVRAIESDRPLERNLLGCLEERGAAARIVDAVRRRLGRSTSGDSSSIFQAETSDAGWQEAMGKWLAGQVQVLVPGDVPFAVLFDPDTGDEMLPWWYLEFRDRVAGRLREALPPGSEAAESPEVLDDKALDLLDPSRRGAALDQLIRLGYRRTLLLKEVKVEGTEAIDIYLTVIENRDGSLDDGKVRILRKENAADDVDVNASLEPQQDKYKPGDQVTLVVLLSDKESGDPVRGRPMEAIVGGRTLEGWEEVSPGRYAIAFTIPESLARNEELKAAADPTWPLSWSYRRADGGIAPHDTPLKLDFGFTVVEKLVEVERGRVGMDDGGVQVLISFGAGLFSGTGGPSGTRLGTTSENVPDEVRGYDLSDRTLWGRARGARIPIGATVTWKYVKASLDFGVRIPAAAATPRWWPTVNGILLEVNPNYSVDIGGSVQGGIWVDRVGIFAGVWAAWVQEGARASAIGEGFRGSYGVSGSGAAFGPHVSVDVQLVDNFGVGVDIQSHVLGSLRGTVAPFTSGQLRLWARLRVKAKGKDK